MENRIRSYTQSWFITEPVLFSVWNTHKLVKNNKIDTLRIGNGKVEYNEEFVKNLSDKDLKTLLMFEAFRILVKHPYERAKPNAMASYTASNVTIQEYLSTQLEMPNAKKLFENLLAKNQTDMQKKFLEIYDDLMELDDSELEKNFGVNKSQLTIQKESIPSLEEEDIVSKHFEFYYNLLEKNLPQMLDNPLYENVKQKLEDLLNEQKGQSQKGQEDQDGDSESQEDQDGQEGQDQDGQENQEGQGGKSLKDHFDPLNSQQNTQEWGEDEFLQNEINHVIQDAQITNNWGNVPGHFKDYLIASMTPKVDYRKILRNFRASVITSDTTVSRMKTNRRYGWQQPGRKRNFTTKIAFFVDVSGSMSNESLRNGFSIINKFFKYGIESIDVYQFDTEIKNAKPLQMQKAKKEVKVLGRGGTDFQPVIDLVESSKTNYDGIIIYTDGGSYAPTLKRKTNKKLLFLYDTERNYNDAKDRLKGIGKVAFIKDSNHI